jgi:hypothetical protein
MSQWVSLLEIRSLCSKRSRFSRQSMRGPIAIVIILPKSGHAPIFSSREILLLASVQGRVELIPLRGSSWGRPAQGEVSVVRSLFSLLLAMSVMPAALLAWSEGYVG